MKRVNVESNGKTTRIGGVTGKGFRPGVSGNPGGRPRGEASVRALARAHTRAALETLARCLEGRQAVQAAVALLDRGWGRPMQTVEANVEEVDVAVLEGLIVQVGDAIASVFGDDPRLQVVADRLAELSLAAGARNDA